MRYALLLCLMFCGCAHWGPAPDVDVLTVREFIVLTDLSHVPNSDPRALSHVRIESDTLKMTARFVGGCQRHDFSLYISRKNEDVVSAFVRHVGNKDTCHAWVEQPLSFSLKYLKKDLKLNHSLTIASYPGEPEPFSVHLP